MFPQAVYFPTRTLYLTLRAAVARKTNSEQVSVYKIVLDLRNNVVTFQY